MKDFTDEQIYIQQINQDQSITNGEVKTLTQLSLAVEDASRQALIS